MLALDQVFSTAPRRRVVTPVPHDRPSTKYARAKIGAALGIAFAALAVSVADQVRRRRLHDDYLDDIDIGDDDDDLAEQEADRVTRGLDFGDLKTIVPVVGFGLGVVAIDQISRMLDRLDQAAQIGPNSEAVALDLARNRAAEMVGMEIDDAGNLVENSDPKWAITETTRDMLRDVISNGIKDGRTADDIAADIASSGAFTDARAKMIARTEVSKIDNAAAVEAFKIARDDGGLPLRKIWLTDDGDNVCDECQANEDDGAVDLDDSFSSGDDAPPLHPSCACVVASVFVATAIGDAD